MNTAVIDQLLKTHETSIVEKHLIYLFVKNNGICISSSNIIANLFDDFKANSDILLVLSSCDVDDLKKLENYLELLIPENDRKVNGAFFTPTYIVDYIIKEVSPKENDKCLDPSCGSGAFLIGLVEYFKQTYKKDIKSIIRDNIYGSDILDYNIKRCKIILSLYGLLNNEIINESDFNIYHQNSLSANWDNLYQVIVGNPPYVKYQDLSNENRSCLINEWESVENGSFNLYFAFFELGYNLLSTDGRLGYITPNSYSTSIAALSLRRYFLNKKCLTKIVDFRYKKVFNAQTYTAISFLNKKLNDFILFDKIKDHQDCSEFLSKVNSSSNYLQDLNVKKWRLLNTNERENIKIIENIGTPIKDLFNISVGIATLKDEVFFIDSSNERDGYLIKKTEDAEFLIEKEITKPVYKISKFKSQSSILDNKLRIITPYITNSKPAVPIPEEEFKLKYPKCYEYLLSQKQKLATRDKGKKEFVPFYQWGRTQGITRFGKKILNPTFSKHPRFLSVLEEDAYYTNGYGIYFKNNDLDNNLSFEYDIHELSKEENILVVQKILNSALMDYYISSTSIAIQGGFPCYQKNFIEKFSIPNFSKDEINILEKITDKTQIDEFLIKKYQVNIFVPNLSS